tara:strand:+ start:346 stop:648 length:303 start_codon:yes stop_codon:yes gene_type:complete
LQLSALVIAGKGNTFQRFDRWLIDLKFEQFVNKYHFGLLVQRLNFTPKQLMASGSWLAVKMSMPFSVSVTSGMEPLLSSLRATQERRCTRRLLFRPAEVN